MRLSKDLIIIEVNPNLIRIYNKYTNSIIEVHKLIYEYLKERDENNDFSDIYDSLTSFQIDSLINSNVLIEDEKEYLSKKFLEKKAIKINKITDAYLHLTLNCNLKCEYCYQRNNLNKFKYLELSSWKKILRILKEEGTERINLTGGEPLIYEDIGKLIAYAFKLGFKINLLTNGMLLNYKDDFYKYIDNIIISLDSLDISLRNGLNTDKVLSNIVGLHERQVCNVIVRSVYLKGSEDKSEELRKYLEKLDIDHIGAMFMPYHSNEIRLIPDYNKYDLIDDDCISSGCGAGSSIVAIDPTGNVYPCQILMFPELKITNILNKNWKEEFKTNKINNEMNNFNKLEYKECSECNYNNICDGGCRGNSYIMYGDFKHRVDYLCDYYRKCSEMWIKNA
ncbi:MAG: SPASM domain-containing protein [Tissierellia bacterium]|nr:SPASM domain-containing protein [Tissierellia bacterium]